MPNHGTVGRKHDQYIETGQHVYETPTDSDMGMQRIHDPKSRMRQFRMSGSVGARGGKPPRATRPPGGRGRPPVESYELQEEVIGKW